MEPRLSTRPRGFPAVRARSAQYVGALALRARRAWCPGLQDDDAFEGLPFWEQLHTRKATFRYSEFPISTDATDQLPAAYEAWTTFEGDKFLVRLSEHTYGGLEIGDPRARFTLGHELGHLTMHLHELVTLRALPALDRGMARTGSEHPIYRDVEWQADVFSSRLLVPDAGLVLLAQSGELTEHRVAHKFGVSKAAARARVEQFRRGGALG